MSYWRTDDELMDKMDILLHAWHMNQITWDEYKNARHDVLFDRTIGGVH